MMRAAPKRYIARSRGLNVVRAQALGIFRDSPEVVGLVEQGEFQQAQKVIDSVDSYSALEVALAKRWIRLERLYRINFQSPTSV